MGLEVRNIVSEFANEYSKYIEIYDWEIIVTIIMIIICPTTWNFVARWEFHTKFFSKLVGDNRLAADIFAHILIEMGILRNYLYLRVVRSQPHYPLDGSYELTFLLVGYSLNVVGFLLNWFAFYRLGIHGIYYADYFGILFEEKVTAFPYNVLNNPLYVGSTLLFVGNAIIHRSPAGILLSILAWTMYKFASRLENPMTDLIYSEENINAVMKINKERNRRTSQERRKLKNEK